MKRDVLLARQPTKKFVEVSEVAELTAFLASNAAASITGAIVPIDGGWSRNVDRGRVAAQAKPALQHKNSRQPSER